MAFKNHLDRLTGMSKLIADCPPSPPLSLCSLALVIALSLSLTSWRTQMATRITMMACWNPPRWCQISFARIYFSVTPTYCPPELILSPRKQKFTWQNMHSSHRCMSNANLYKGTNINAPINSHRVEISLHWLVVLKSQPTYHTFISNLCSAESRCCVKPITECYVFDKAWQQLEHVVLPIERDGPKQ